MAYQCTVPLTELEGSTKFKGPFGYQCVALVQKASGGCSNAPGTSQWLKGKRVLETKIGEIPQGTVIATFDDSGKYPSTQRHTAIYVSHDSHGIWVYHQYAKGQNPEKVHKYYIRNKQLPTRTIMDAYYYFIVE